MGFQQRKGERVLENDLIIAALTGLPQEFDMIKTVILARESPMSLKDFRAQLLSAELTIESKIISLTSTMSAMYVNGDRSNGFNGMYQGESSNMGSNSYQRGFGTGTCQGNCTFQGESSAMGATNNYQGGYGFIGNNQRPFNSQNNSGTFNSNRNPKPYFGNKYKGNSGFSADQGKGSQSDFNGHSSNGGSKSGSTWQSWNGNTNYRSSITPECQICSRRGHTAPNCHFRSTNGSNVSQYQLLVCQICEKKGHAALDCYHRNNYAYQGAPPPQSTITAMSAQGSQDFSQQRDDSQPHGFSAADTWVLDTGATHHMTTNVNTLNQVSAYNGEEKIIIGNGQGQGNQCDSLPRKE